MKKLVLFLLIMGMVFVMGACNDPEEPNTGGEEEDKNIELGYVLQLESGEGYKGGTIDLAEYKLADISKYSEVIVDAQFRDETGEPVTGSPPDTANNDGWGQFFIVKEGRSYGSTNDDIVGGGNGKKYGMAADGETKWIIPSDVSGKPGLLQIETAHGDIVKSVYIRKITFLGKSSERNEVIYDWGTGAQTELFPTDNEWPGKSLPLDGAVDIEGILGDITLYREVIVDAIVLDRNENEFAETGKKPIDPAFFTLTTAEGQWEISEIVKRYNMNVIGETSVAADDVDPDTKNQVTKGWGPGTPTHIVFQGQYKSSASNDEMVGYVILRKITFVLK